MVHGQIQDLKGDTSFASPIIVRSPVSTYILPQEILTYTPPSQWVRRKFNNGEVLRQIFMNQPLEDFELELIEEMKRECEKEGVQIPEGLSHTLLRVISYNFRKYKQKFAHKSLEMLANQIEWRKSYFPIDENEVLDQLKKGVIYCTGRDNCLRPTLIIRLSRMPKEWTPQVFTRLVIYCFEYLLRYALFPGKVETLVVLIDLKGVSLMKVPVNALTEMTSMLTKQYPFRLHNMYILNAPSLIQWIWNAVKGALSEVQQSKVNFVKPDLKEMKGLWASHQLEEQYGGGLPEVSTFYPFPFQKGPFEADHVTGPRRDAVADVWKIFDDDSYKGELWLTPKESTHPPQKFSSEAPGVFRRCGVPFTGVAAGEPSGEGAATAAAGVATGAGEAAPLDLTVPVAALPAVASASTAAAGEGVAAAGAAAAVAEGGGGSVSKRSLNLSDSRTPIPKGDVGDPPPSPIDEAAEDLLREVAVEAGEVPAAAAAAADAAAATALPEVPEAGEALEQSEAVAAAVQPAVAREEAAAQAGGMGVGVSVPAGKEPFGEGKGEAEAGKCACGCVVM
uniref:CRAL-TRIO domain-containing protein n=1 Tax=Chromera velia CCMP2878 TaxID=1169474 RepID=A0A0G4F9Z9_9ALVE|eukprot:Cvel_15805.t1-p1 / transcript=Cvel_15805.t1 / gene=Cvel_15805 / organism=Chromera_velia_CCMP2878 / gene_product=CRAL-TRIO domain-containing protein C3H8.02, putative / transcript_product=CRAL-TRIO domain-containing protein C3H8.02, putative / location=Cvel_scaffold1187:6721-11565(+) / protein_length=562 / sequence_SO=supercontig / SO=protein_coding / is_pseudo=false